MESPKEVKGSSKELKVQEKNNSQKSVEVAKTNTDQNVTIELMYYENQRLNRILESKLVKSLEIQNIMINLIQKFYTDIDQIKGFMKRLQDQPQLQSSTRKRDQKALEKQEIDSTNYLITPKLCQILKIPYNTSSNNKSLNTYPETYIYDLLINYAETNGQVNGGYAEFGTEMKKLGVDRVHQTQIIAVLANVGLISKMFEVD